MRITVNVNQAARLRRSAREDFVSELREGRRNRATTFRARKGKGSYSRTTKHKEF